VNDAIAAARWASENLGTLGGADKPLALGDSAGGNFAAVTAIRGRDAGIKIAAQVLIYGALGRGDSNPDIAYMYFGPDRAKDQCPATAHQRGSILSDAR
jgi:acetyl esterase